MQRSLSQLLSFLIVFNFVIQAAADSPPPPNTFPRIEWKRETLSLIQTNGGYARIIRLKDGRLICGFDVRGKIWVRHSDDGKVWRNPVQVAEWPFGSLTNTELLQLRDGSLLCLYNQRPHRSRGNSETTNETHPFAIGITRSDDAGKTWQKPEQIYSAGSEFKNGCWEPAAIELPSGEVQLFFSDENPYRESDEQNITLLRSKDGGRTWSSPDIVSFRPRHRDGMAVPLLLKNNEGIVFAIEDNGLSGNFKPVIIHSSLADNWRSGTRMPGSTNRWSALRERLPPHVAASAPYLSQMPSGETLLSFQQTETGEMKDAYMVVCIGDSGARHFGSSSIPFPVDGRREQLWNSLFVKNSQTVIAVSQTIIHGTAGIWSVEGRFVNK